MRNKTVDFYFDFSSPYSYIGSRLIEKVCQDNGAELRWQPIVLGGLFQSNNTTPSFQFPKRAKYMAGDLEDLASFHKIPFQQRTEFLFKPILSLRIALVLPQGTERAKAVHALFNGVWAQDLDLGQPEVVARLLTEAGFDGPKLLEKTQDEAIKAELKENTERADRMGIFGAPFSVVNDGEKMFWGHDRLPLLDHYLKNT